jgi:hypothetical protein
MRAPSTPPPHPAITDADVDRIAAALRHHSRDLSPTGTGVKCACGEHYPDVLAWHLHLARLAHDAIA